MDIDWIEAERLDWPNAGKALDGFDGILVPGGFGKRGIEGMLNAIRYAREEKIPVFRHLPGHADHGDRIRSQRLWIGSMPIPRSSIRRRRTA